MCTPSSAAVLSRQHPQLWEQLPQPPVRAFLYRLNPYLELVQLPLSFRLAFPNFRSALNQVRLRASDARGRPFVPKVHEPFEECWQSPGIRQQVLAADTGEAE